jgi:hypothetical protein
MQEADDRRGKATVLGRAAGLRENLAVEVLVLDVTFCLEIQILPKCVAMTFGRNHRHTLAAE